MGDSMVPPKARRTLLSCLILVLALHGCGKSGGGSGGGVGAEHVSIFATQSDVTSVTGESEVRPMGKARTAGLDGSVIYTDVLTYDVIRISPSGLVEVLVTSLELQTAIGIPDAFETSLTSLMTIRGGALDGQILGRTRQGRLVEISPSGQFSVHPTLILLGPPAQYGLNQILVQLDAGPESDDTGAFLLLALDGSTVELAAAADVIAITGSEAKNFSVAELVVSTNFVSFAVVGLPANLGVPRVIRIAADGTVTEPFTLFELSQLTATPGPVFGSGFVPSNLVLFPGSDTLYFLACGCGDIFVIPNRRWVVKLESNGTLVTVTDLADHVETVAGAIGFPFSGPSGSVSVADIIFLGRNFRLESFGLFETPSGVIPYALEGYLQSMHVYDSSGTPEVYVGQKAIFNLVNTPINLSGRQRFGALEIPGVGAIVFDVNTDTFFLIEL